MYFYRRNVNRKNSAENLFSLPLCVIMEWVMDMEENHVGAIIDRPQDVELSQYGKMVDNAIQNIPSAYPALSLEGYIIMPNHIHLLVRVCADEYGRPLVAPTMSRVIKQLKGIVSKQAGLGIWQKSFHDHIIRNREDYEEHLRYIYENPLRWRYDELYTEE